MDLPRALEPSSPPGDEPAPTKLREPRRSAGRPRTVASKLKALAASSSDRLPGIQEEEDVAAAPVATARSKASEENFLWADGKAHGTKPLASAALKAWSVAQVWQAALGEPLHPPAPRKRRRVALGGEQPWADMATQAMEHLAATQPGRSWIGQMQISAEAVDLLGRWTEDWLCSLLAEAHRLSLHRVMMLEDTVRGEKVKYDFSLQEALLADEEAFREAAEMESIGAQKHEASAASSEAPADAPAGTVARQWEETLQQRRQLRCIGLAELRAALCMASRGAPSSAVPWPRGLALDRLLQILDKDELAR